MPTPLDLFGKAGRPDALKHLKEDSTSASAYASVYPLMGKGNHLVKITLDPQNYQDAQGAWHKIDTSLVHTAPGADPGDGIIYEGSGWTNQDGPVKVFFPDALAPDSPVTWTVDQGSLSIVPLGLSEKVVGQLDEEWVRYSGVLPAVDVAYSATAMGYKENVSFAEPPLDKSAQWDVQASGLTLSANQEEGSIIIRSEQGQVGYFPAAVATDASEGEGHPVVSSNFPYALEDLGGGHYTITVTYDAAFLEDPATVYPVVLDPSPTTEKRVQKDTWAWSATGHQSENQNGSGNLQAGGSTGTKYPYVKFDLSCCRDPDHLVYWAQMALKPTGQSQSSNNGDVDVYRVKTDWGETSLTWNLQPEVGTTVWDTATAGDVQGGWQYWDGLGDLYQNLIDETYSHYGVQLKAPNTANWHVWCSDDNGNSYCTPSSDKGHLWFVYNDLPPAPTVNAPEDDATIQVASPTLSVTGMPVDPDGDDVRLNFQVSDDGLNWTGTHLAWASDWIDDINAVVDAGALKDGEDYYWRVQSADWCEEVDDVCSNEDGAGQTHARHASDDGAAEPNSFTVNLPHYGTDSRWPVWAQALGNGMTLQVNEATGNLFLNYPLDAPVTPAGPLAMGLTYNSQLTSDLGLGNGWNVSAGLFSDGLRLPTSLTPLDKDEGDGVRIAYGDGNQAHFSKLAGNTYVGEGNDPGTVFKNPQDDETNKWTYTSASGSVYTFADDGSLLTAAPASDKWGLPGYSYTFTTIGGVPYLDQVKAPEVDGDTNQIVTFDFSGTPTRLQSISTWVPAETWDFGYDTSNRLISITDPVLQEVDFGYDGTSDRLGSVKDGQLVADPGSDATTISYDQTPGASTDYRVTGIQAPPPVPSGTAYNPTLFCYDAIQNGLVVNQTAVVDPRGSGECPTQQDPSVGFTTWTDFNTAGLPIQVAGPYDDNTDLPITRMVWDGNGNLLCSESPEAFALDDSTIDCLLPAGEDDLTVLDTALNTYQEYQTDPPYRQRSVTGPAPDGDAAHRAHTDYAYDEGFTGLVRQEFANNSMSGVPGWENVTNLPVNSNWYRGYPDNLPDGTTKFSLRYTGTLFPSTAHTYKFKLSSGGGVKLVIGKTLLLNCWADSAWPNCGGTVVSKYFGGVKPKNVTIEYRYNDTDHDARIQFEWDQGEGDWEDVPVSVMAPASNLATTVTDDHGATSWAYSTDEAKLRALPTSRERGGRTTSWTYDDYARVLTETVDLGSTDPTTNYTYSDDGTTSCRDSTTDPAGAETTYECDAAGRVTASILHVPAVPGTNQDEQYRRVDTEYDDLGRVMHVSIPHEDGTTTTVGTDYEYDQAGRLLDTTDPMGLINTHTYDQMGRLTVKVMPDPDGAGGQEPPEYHYGYDAVGNQTTMVDPWGVADAEEEAHTWSTQYDALNRVVETTTPQSDTQTFNTTTSYDLADRTVTVEVPGGPPVGGGTGITMTTVSTHDLLGRLLTRQVESIDRPDTWSYDDAANTVAAVQDGISTVSTFDAFGEAVQESCQDCGGTGVDYNTYQAYDDAGRLVQTVDARGEDDADTFHAWRYTYDEVGRLLSSQLPDEEQADDGAITSFVYDAAGEMIQISQPGATSAIVRDYAFDVRGRLDSLATARGTATYGYDDANRLTDVTLPSGMPSGAATTLQYTYDNLGRRTQRQGKTSTQTVVNREQFAYDSNGNPTSASTYGGTPPSVSIDYDFANRPVEVTENSSTVRTTDYTYLGTQLASEQDSAGTNDYSYLGGSGLLGEMTSPLSTTDPVLTYTYDSFGRVETREDGPSGLTWTVVYDPDNGRVASKDAAITGGNGVVCFERSYDEVGNVTQEARTAGVRCSGSHTPSWNTYEYLNNNRLSQATEFGTPTTFGYDGAGNRTTVGSLVTTFDGAGYPDSRSDNVDYTTDPLGNLTCVTATTCTNGTQYKYDAWGRTSQAKIGSNTYNYTYDALDRTVSKSGAASATFSYVGTSQDAVLMSTAGSTFYYDYTRAGPLGQKTGSTTRFYLSDMHGDVVGLVKPDQSSSGSTEFDAWGNKVASLTTGTQAYLGFQGDPTDADTGWVDMGARNYLASLGRFMSSDPLFGDVRNPISLNQFAYGLDNPLTMNDPEGLCPVDPDNPGCLSRDQDQRSVVSPLVSSSEVSRRLLAINNEPLGPTIDFRYLAIAQQRYGVVVQYSPLAVKAAKEFGVDARLLVGLMFIEGQRWADAHVKFGGLTRFAENTENLLKSDPSLGLMQIKFSTFMGIQGRHGGEFASIGRPKRDFIDRMDDPAAALRYAAAHLSDLASQVDPADKGNLPVLAAMYNGGDYGVYKQFGSFHSSADNYVHLFQSDLGSLVNSIIVP